MHFRGYMLAALVSIVAGGVRYATSPSAPAPTEVTIKLFQFEPASVTTRAGEHVHFKNVDQVEHVIRSGSAEHPTDDIKTLPILTDSIGVVVLRTPGRYPYYCERHAFMHGEITITK